MRSLVEIFSSVLLIVSEFVGEKTYFCYLYLYKFVIIVQMELSIEGYYGYNNI